MKIALDISQTAFEGTGVARYTYSLIRSLLAHNSHNDEYTFFYSSLRKDPPLELQKLIQAPHRLIRAYIPPTLLSFLWNTLHILPIEYFIGTHDVVVSSDWTQPPVKHGKAVTVVHDMIPYIYPETSTTSTQFAIKDARITPNIVKTHTQRLRRVSQRCDVIIADSESTKDDIARLLNIPLQRIKVVYPAVTYQEVTPEDVTKTHATHNITKPYIVAVGKLEPRKNIHALIEAFQQSSLHSSHELVLIGSSGWGDIQTRHKGVRTLGFVTDTELFALYKGADMCVMPSLYEGFGFPILEAMAVGCPVACSNTSSLGELAKDHAVTFDPTDVSSITHALEHLQKAVQAGTHPTREAQQYARSFTPKAFAHAFTHVLHEVYS